jgi:hypothetical protein
MVYFRFCLSLLHCYTHIMIMNVMNVGTMTTFEGWRPSEPHNAHIVAGASSISYAVDEQGNGSGKIVSAVCISTLQHDNIPLLLSCGNVPTITGG